MKTLIKKILREDRKKITPKEVHKAADSVGMKWDNNKKFMDFSKKITGKEHIDDMSSEERKKLIKKILEEQFYVSDKRSDLEKFASAYNDFNDPKFLKHILSELDNSIVIEDVVGSDKIETDWVAWLEEKPFEMHLCYGCTGKYTYPNTGDLNLARDYEDNDHTVSAIAIMLEEIFAGEWMDYYYVVNKYLQDRIYKYMKGRNYPYKHDLDW